MRRFCSDLLTGSRRGRTQMHTSLAQLLDGLLRGASADNRAVAGNFLMEQRLPASLRAIYRDCFGPEELADLGEWRFRHSDFLHDLKNLPALRAIGFSANRGLLEVETISQDCTLADGVFAQVTQPQVVDGQRAPGPRIDDARVIALFQVLCLFLGLPEGFRNASMRDWMAQALAVPVTTYSPGRMTYDLRRLRRLRLHGLIERIPHSHQAFTALFDQAKLEPCKI